jgi:hypothetical protein
MEYSVDYCDKLMDQQLDKMGSDLFTLPIKLMQFRKATYDFIRETTTFFEATQEISDDLKMLLKSKNVLMTKFGREGKWFSVNPNDYHRLIMAKPKFVNKIMPTFSTTQSFSSRQQNTQKQSFETRYHTVKIIKLGQEIIYKRSPYKKPTHEYPVVQRLSDKIMFDFGSDDGTDYKIAEISYIKEPSFGFDEQLLLKISEDYTIDDYPFSFDDKIVDLPPIAIHKIIDRACNSLRVTSADTISTQTYAFDQTFGKRNK